MIRITHKKVRDPLYCYVRKVSVFECPRPPGDRHRLIPSPCSYLSYNHRNIPFFVSDRKIRPEQRLQITGPKTDPGIHVEYTGELSQVLIEFAPAAFYYLFHQGPADYRNQLLDLTHFIPAERGVLLSKQLRDCGDSEQRIELLQDFLEELAFHALPFCDYVEETIREIDSRTGDVLVKELSDRVHISERQLNRRFTQLVGISPKVYAKILQLHHVIGLMARKDLSTLKEISYGANFYDPSHFDHRFRELVGITPQEFLVSREHNALRYYTNEREAVSAKTTSPSLNRPSTP